MIEKILQDKYYHSLDESKQKSIHELLDYFEYNQKLYLANQPIEIFKRRVFRDCIPLVSAVCVSEDISSLINVPSEKLIAVVAALAAFDLLILPHFGSIQKKEYVKFNKRNERNLARQIQETDSIWRKNSELPKNFPRPQFLNQFKIFKSFKNI